MRATAAVLGPWARDAFVAEPVVQARYTLAACLSEIAFSTAAGLPVATSVQQVARTGGLQDQIRQICMLDRNTNRRASYRRIALEQGGGVGRSTPITGTRGWPRRVPEITQSPAYTGQT